MVKPIDGAKKAHIAARDIISGLPGNAIDRILELLPIGDAVKTSALARNWRYNWAAMSKLNFDDEFYRYLYLHKGMPEFKIASIITKFLLLHDGPVLHITLCFPGLDEAILGDIDSYKLYIYSPSLVHLDIIAGKPDFICMRTENLRYLTLFRVFWMAENPKNGVSNLVKEIGKISKIVKLFLGQPWMDSLKFLYAGPTPSRLPSPLNFLQKVTFCLLDLGDPAQILAAFCLIRSAPTLQKLVISDVSDTGDSVSTAVMTILEEKCVLRCLQVVRICYVKGSRVELELIKSILASSPLLKSMLLMCSKPVDEYSMFSEELLKFHRVSSKAEIVYN